MIFSVFFKFYSSRVKNSRESPYCIVEIRFHMRKHESLKSKVEVDKDVVSLIVYTTYFYETYSIE